MMVGGVIIGLEGSEIDLDHSGCVGAVDENANVSAMGFFHDFG